MSKNQRGGLRSAFSHFSKPAEIDAERKLLGRDAETPPQTTQKTEDSGKESQGREVVAMTHTLATTPVVDSYATAINELPRLMPRPVLAREPVRQLSFRCPQSAAFELRRKAAFNQLEQQEILLEGLRRVLAELADPPPGWQA